MTNGALIESQSPTSGRGRGHRRPTVRAKSGVPHLGHANLEADLYRNIVFPNRIREQRNLRGFLKLFALAATIPTLTYIRLSKIERGEVFARSEEIRWIASALGVDPLDLLINVDSIDFDIAVWSAPFRDAAIIDSSEEVRFALLLAAALRAKRTDDESLNAAAMAREYGIPPVVLSRLENAFKCVSRWNDETIASLCRLFRVGNMNDLESLILSQYQAGDLDAYLDYLPTSATRIQRTKRRIAALREELTLPLLIEQKPPIQEIEPLIFRRRIPVFGVPLADGLVAMSATGDDVEAPSFAGPRAFGFRIGRATLGGGLPGQATVIVDPDRFPQAGGLALVRETGGHRVLAVAIGKDGAMIGYSVTPPQEIALDNLLPEDVASIVAAMFV
jgi:transcriptional regulator with XRE-family HTH domain